ncbi:membrane protein PM19L-like isoform X3 [Triticum aestivum]|uniref:membrane protein PM19L-like isoform X2 n=1 Tax=Triticum aestivum TaxID=4565 RepID=UPI001D005098|nr:membrane protein PM19L-like isoform X2 [Triticum aestivum]XP_044455089.1 membrane protein PM19L-like isoform X3 [Triticum aestivum]
MAGVSRSMVAPLLVLNLVMYIVVIGLASWNLNHFINGTTNYAGVAGNGATFYFLLFAILAGVHHVRTWRGDSLATSASSALVAWAITALAFGLACKEIHVGGHRGWRLRVLEAFIVILAFTQLLYVMALHAGLFGGQFGGAGAYGAEHQYGDHHHKGMGTAAPATARV